MKIIFQLASLFFALASMNQVHSSERDIATAESKTVFICESVKEEAQGFKTARNCKMSDGTKTNILFKKDANLEIIVGQ
jgi:hypothetical protein